MTTTSLSLSHSLSLHDTAETNFFLQANIPDGCRGLTSNK